MAPVHSVKTCTKCEKSLPLKKFNKNGKVGRLQAYRPYCKPCSKLLIPKDISEKTCKTCEKSLPLNRFWKCGGFTNGLMAHCSDCMKVQRQAKFDSRVFLKVAEKACSRCEKTLLIEDFHKNKKSLDGHDWNCKKCTSDDQKIKRVEFLKNRPSRIKPAEQTCQGCKESLPASAFTDYAWLKNGLNKHCRICMRVRKYGLSKAQWIGMIESQDGKCDACQAAIESDGYRWNAPAVDHNHVTGEVRGILCGMCNSALGLAKDDPEVLRGLLRYLEKHTSKEEQMA